ncbi:MAG: glycerol-3-phosphate 1-O-acyltransferase PlsY [Planctomycetes bacterium]|nr:glycerol-3-phosphate 1-O-acyltransferase PlsY [Planctomycetota bacterium]
MDSGLVISIVGVVVSYLLGAIPFGFIIAKVFRGVDVRAHGSGNIGATNVGRVLGRKWGLLALVLDIAKGFGPAALAAFALGEFSIGGACPSTAVTLCGAAAICGHIWPIYLRFKGGKGVATSCGVLLYLEPVGTLAAVAVWVVAVLIWRYVSLGSILAATVLVVYVLTMSPRRGGNAVPLIVFGILMAALVIIRHRSNIGRLLNGTENRVGGKKKKQEEAAASDPPTQPEE